MTPATVQLHLKVLSEPTTTTRAEMVQSMTAAFAPFGIGVVVASQEPLALPHLDDLDVGAPTLEGPITPEQGELYQHRYLAAPEQIHVYFVRSLFPPWSGCASLVPDGRPSAVVASVASRWTLAHECGHLLRLPHVDVPERVMMDMTWRIGKDPADLTQGEADAMKANPLMQ